MDFYQQRATGGIERIRGAANIPGNCARAYSKRSIARAGPRRTELALHLWHVDVGAKRSGLRDAKQQGTATGHQRADIHIP